MIDKCPPGRITRFCSVCGLTATVIISGCAGTPPPDETPIADALVNASTQIAAAWRQVGAVKEAEHPELKDYLDDYHGHVPVALQQHINLQWAGPISQLVHRLSAEIGWGSPHVIGLAPSNQIPVFVNATDTPIAEILRDVGYQAGDRANLIVDAENKRLELVYNGH